jgi:hypothetical protein
MRWKKKCSQTKGQSVGKQEGIKLPNKMLRGGKQKA